MHERHGRRRIATVLALTSAISILPAGSALAGTRLINFDDRVAPSTFADPSAKVLTNEYAGLGVTFAGPVAGQGGAILNQGGGFGVTGHSPPNFLAFNTSTYAKGPETITFTNPAHSVEIKTGQSGGGTVTATAFNGTTPVSSSFRTATAAVAPLNLNASRITSVKLEFTGGAVIFDDLKWGTAPISGDESFEVTQGQVLTVAAPGVLGNDSDPDGDTLTPTVARQPGAGTVDLRADGSFTYTPNASFFGTDSFTYRAGDGTGSGNEATVTIKVNQLPPPPPPPPPPPALRTPAVTISFALTKSPTRVSIFRLLQLKNIPKGSRVSVVCLTKKGKRCKGKLKASILVKKTTKGSLRLKKLQRRRYPAGSRIDATITNPKFKTQHKTLVIRKRSNPSIVTRCSTPPSKKRRSC